MTNYKTEPYRFGPLRRPRQIFWGGGCYVLMHFTAKTGTHRASLDNLFTGTKIVKQRVEETASGFEAVFLLKVGRVPLATEGDLFVANISGHNDEIPPDDPPFCATNSINITYFRTFIHPHEAGLPGFLYWQFRQSKTAISNDPNGTQVSTDDNVLGAGFVLNDATNIAIIEAAGAYFTANTPAPENGSSQSLWKLDKTTNKYVNLNLPCHDVEPPHDTQKIFGMKGWIFPTKDITLTDDPFYPLKGKGDDTYDDLYTFQIGLPDDLLEPGSYPFRLERRRFRDFDLSTDHDGDVPQKPFPAATEATPVTIANWQAAEKNRVQANQTRVDNAHKMLELWMTTHNYFVRFFRYPPPPPPAGTVVKPGKVGPAVFDNEWIPLHGLNGPPPALQTEDANT
jgi:hypothetical protein